MGLSANQAKFLAITARKVDLEHRMQTLTNRRIGLANQVDDIADNYNRALSDRKLFVKDMDSYEAINLEALFDNGYMVYDNVNQDLLGVESIMASATPPETFTVSSAEGLAQAIAMNPTGNIVISSNIDLTGAGPLAANFEGKFYGNGNTITTDGPIFTKIAVGAEVNDLIVTAASSATLGSGEGLVAEKNYGTIDNVMVSGTINAGNQDEVGGVVGENFEIIKNTSFNGTINNGGDRIGGIAGTNWDTIENVLVEGSINGDNEVGGMAGTNVGTISKATSLANVTGSSDNVGGVAGESSGSIDAAMSTGKVKGNTFVGGLVGQTNSGSVSNSYSVSEIDASGSTYGAIAGVNSALCTISNTYATIGDSGLTNAVGSGVGGTMVSDYTALSAATLGSANWDAGTDIPELKGVDLTTSTVAGPPSGTYAENIKSGGNTYSASTTGYYTDGSSYYKVKEDNYYFTSTGASSYNESTNEFSVGSVTFVEPNSGDSTKWDVKTATTTADTTTYDWGIEQAIGDTTDPGSYYYVDIADSYTVKSTNNIELDNGVSGKCFRTAIAAGYYSDYLQGTPPSDFDEIIFGINYHTAHNQWREFKIEAEVDTVTPGSTSITTNSTAVSGSSVPSGPGYNYGYTSGSDSYAFQSEADLNTFTSGSSALNSFYKYDSGSNEWVEYETTSVSSAGTVSVSDASSTSGSGGLMEANTATSVYEPSTPAAGWSEGDSTYSVTNAFGALTSQELEEGLRNGTYDLVREEDTQTQSSVTPTGANATAAGLNSENYEKFDWRTTPTVSDELDESNDVEAKAKYESELKKLNLKDMEMEMEMETIESEYNAITNERDSISKLIAKNSEKSFKLFS